MLKLSMYLRMITRALVKRKSRVVIALASLIIGTGVISGVLSVYYDINLKMSKELRSYGANFVLTPEQGNLINTNNIGEVASRINSDKIVGYSPYLYRIGQVKERKLVVVGLWLDQVEKVSPYWEITGENKFERDDFSSALVGINVASKLGLKIGNTINVRDEDSGKNMTMVVNGFVRTGSTEDSQVFINLAAAQQIFSQENQANLVYFSIVGKSDELSQNAERISRGISGANLKPIKQISKGEGLILDKIKALVYLVIIIILLSTLLCVSTTMMTMVIERRREIGLRKALGAQNWSIISEFLGEGLALGLAGGLVGTILGMGIAQVIGQSVFKSYISLRFEVVAVVVAMSLAVAGIASVMPVRTAANVEPALILKGE